MVHSFKHTLGLVLSPVLLLVTLATSLLVVGATIWRRQLRTSTNALLICMVLPQLMLVTTESSVIFTTSYKGHWSVNATSCRCMQMLLPLTFGASMYHQVSLALQRYLHILHNNKVLRSVRGVVVCLVLSWTLPLLPTTYFLLSGTTNVRLNMDDSFVNQTDTSTRNETYIIPAMGSVLNETVNLTQISISDGPSCLHQGTADTKKILMWCACFVLSPMFIIIFCYLSIYKRSRYFTSQLRITRRSSMNRRRRDGKLMRLSLILLFVAVMGNGPYIVVRCLNMSPDHLALLITTCINCLACGNSAVIYGFQHTQFRLVFLFLIVYIVYGSVGTYYFCKTKKHIEAASTL